MTRALDSLLFGVTRLDALTLIVSVSTLGGVALIATLVPARRAARTDPAGSLQSDWGVSPLPRAYDNVFVAAEDL